MITITSIWALPLLFIIWSANGYLFLLMLRLVVGQLHGTRQSQFSQAICHCTDGAALVIQNRLKDWFGRSIPAWFAWLVVVIGLLAVRHLCIGILLSLA